MHEMSIVRRMMAELMRIAQENNARKIANVNLKVGKMSGIAVDFLQSAFDTLKTEYPILSSAKIIIKETPLIYGCNNCKNTFSPQDESDEADETDEILSSCPECKSHNLKLVSGEELQIENLELET